MGALCLLIACTNTQPFEATQTIPTESPTESPPGGVRQAPLGISEVQARRELDAMFREAGIHVLNDEPLRIGDIEVVLDGYDPDRRIGYEYIADGEAAASPSLDVFAAADDGRRVLAIRACTLGELRRVASSFLGALEPIDAGT